jgi:hypothetical protein
MERRKATYATFLAETLHGLDTWMPRARQRAFAPGDLLTEEVSGDGGQEVSSDGEYHNELWYPCTRLLIKRAFGGASTTTIFIYQCVHDPDLAEIFLCLLSMFVRCVQYKAPYHQPFSSCLLTCIYGLRGR